MATKPFFVPQKEIQLFDAFNEELIDDIVGQVVDIYKVSLDETDVNIYGEAADGILTFDRGFRVNCLIQFETPDMDMTEFGADLNAAIGMYFHRNSLRDSDFYPEVGDIVDWNGFYFEINSVTEPQLIAGHPDYKHDVIVTAHRRRMSSVNFSERIR